MKIFNKIAIMAIVTVIATTSIFVSCKKEENALSSSKFHKNLDGDEFECVDGEIVLGEPINDPYRLENMHQAYQSLIERYGDIPIPPIEPTHRYMRFLPKSDEELVILQSDTNLLWWDYPLDYEVLVHGTYYKDPEFNEEDPFTWQYCVIPIDYSYPEQIYHELLYEVFIPEDNGEEIYELLEEEAYLITNNLSDEDLKDYIEEGLPYPIEQTIIKKNRKAKTTKWTPSATIKTYDDIVGGYIPIEGAKVTARYGTKIKEGITNNAGYCAVNGSFQYQVNYAIKWERAYWDIREGSLGQAYYNGPKQKKLWTLYISNGKSLSYATIHSAAMKYYYGNNLGLRRPILAVGKTKISYYHTTCEDFLGLFLDRWNLLGILPNIKIWGYSSSSGLLLTNKLYGTVIHELGHLSHARFIGDSFKSVNDFVAESWATCIAWKLTEHRYQIELSGYPNCSTYSHYLNKQDWAFRPYSNDPYTPIFIDLIDDYNQSLLNSYFINDMISGYTLSEIQQYLIPHAYNLSTLRDNLKKHKLHSITDEQIDELLLKYNNIYGF